MSVEGTDKVLTNLDKWVKERLALAELAMNEVMAALEVKDSIERKKKY